MTSVSKPEDSTVMRCLGRFKRFDLQVEPSLVPPDIPQTISTKYVRSVGSTLILYSEPNSRGRRIGRAQSLGPIAGSAVEVGPIEGSLVDLSIRIEKDGLENTMIDPARQLASRAFQVAQRSVAMFASAIFPVNEFAKKMKSRVPEIANESIEIASSIRIEIKIEEEEPK